MAVAISTICNMVSAIIVQKRVVLTTAGDLKGVGEHMAVLRILQADNVLTVPITGKHHRCLIELHCDAQETIACAPVSAWLDQRLEH